MSSADRAKETGFPDENGYKPDMRPDRHFSLGKNFQDSLKGILSKMKKLLSAAVTAALACGISTSVMAAEPGWYALGAIGVSHADSDLHDLTVAEAYAVGYSASVETTEAGVGLKLIGGYRVNDNFAVEGGYYYLGEAESEITSSAYTAKNTITGHMLAVDAVGILPLGNVFELFGKAGVGLAMTKFEVGATGPGGHASYSANENRLALKLGFGCEWNINQRIGIRAEYERTIGAAKVYLAS